MIVKFSRIFRWKTDKSSKIVIINNFWIKNNEESNEKIDNKEN